ncbi:MAG: DUF3575 domain-containing protein, partial [Alistipes sp.]|nr:DUF3575 domain-containing protein [Alistipes sp.]
MFFAICSVGPVRAQTAAEGARHEGKKISWREVEWALKTNLLTDGVGAPGLEAEVVVAERFSAAAGVTYADVSAGAGRYKIQTFHGNIEGRYWFPRRQEMRREIRHETRPESRSEPRQGTQPETAGRPLTGWYAGV